MTSAANDTTAPAPAVAPQSEAVAEPPQIAPTPVATIRTRVPERPAVAADDGAHIPALFGAAFALGIIVLGSIVARLGAKLIRSRRRGGVREAAPKEQPPFLHVQDTPALVPPMPREDDITRRAPPPWMTRGAPAARRNDAASSEDAAPRIPDSARALEQNVRELLHRMRSELPRMPGASADPQPRSPQELDELLASWRGVRRRPAAR